MKQNDWKSRLGVMYSTNPDYKYQMDEEAVAALVMLGFQKASSQKAIDSLLKKTPDMTVEQLIKTALTML